VSCADWTLAGCGLLPLWISLRVLLGSMILLLVVGLPLAMLLSRPGWRGRTLLEIAVTLPLIFPPVAIGFFFLLALGRKGWINRLLPPDQALEIIFSFWALLLASVLAGLPLMVKPVQAALEKETRPLVEAAYSLGKNRWQTFWHVTLPGISRAVAAGLTLGLGRGMGEVGMSLMLGGNLIGKTETLSLAIYNAVLDGNFHCAMIYAWILAGLALLLFAGLRWFGRRTG
jgi:molybdate transport system permease protein